MKTFLLSALLTALVCTGKSQLILSQDFSNSTVNWITANGSSISTYQNAGNGCATEYGIITPGVGGNNPAKVLSEIIVPNQRLVEVRFIVSRFDANLNCSSISNFGCATSVDIIAVASNYNGIDPVGDGAVIYSNNQGYLLPIAGGTVSLVINLPITLPSFKVFFDFSTFNCNQPGTKYVLDKFRFTGLQSCPVANTCPPVANDDYFNAGAQAFTSGALLGNVYGTNLAYTPSLTHNTYLTRSLTTTAISPLGGNDFDINNNPLSQMNFSLLSQTFTAADANFIFNSDGTFSFARLNPNVTQFYFTYRLTNPTGLFDGAVVRIDYTALGALPVSLVNFNAEKTNFGAQLSWQTLQENSNKGFVILRKTTGSFEKIAFVESKADNNTSSSILNYSFKDVTIPAGIKTVYYRLLQVDLNGRETYSDIKVIQDKNNNEQPLLIYPNPSPGDLKVIIPSVTAGTNTIEVINAAGGVIKRINTSEKQINITGLISGMYVVKVNTGSGNFYTQKLIVQ